MNTLEFIHLHPVGSDCCTLEKSANPKEVEAWLCLECGTCKPSLSPVDVRIQESSPQGSITFVNGYGITIVKRDFLEALGLERVKPYLAIGTVYGRSGELMPDWVTVRARHRLIVRGSKNVSYRDCKTCGKQFYFAMGQRYLYPAPPPGVPLFESDLCGLIVSPEMLDGVPLSRWRKLGIEKLKVLLQPKDSLGELRVESCPSDT
jgi:hypothetical protein